MDGTKTHLMDIDLVVVACVDFPMIFIKVAICHVKILKKKTHHVIYLRIHYAKKILVRKIIYIFVGRKNIPRLIEFAWWLGAKSNRYYVPK